MAREPAKNVAASVRARLLDRARKDGSDFQVLLTRYALERLLYRLSQSVHRDRFILKGAMLFVTWVEDPFRPTRDLDLLGYGDNTPGAIRQTFREICALPVDDDGVIFESEALDAAPIREEVDYGGVRVRTSATIAGARIPIQVDIGFGDAITPGPVDIEYPSLLGAPAANLRAYPMATTIAEKFEAMVTLGMANSRLKDFYDLWMISQTFEFDRLALAEAVRQTFARRETVFPTEIPTGLSEDYAANWDKQWNAFLTRDRMAPAPVSLTVILVDLRAFLLPLTEAGEITGRWIPNGGWSKA